MTQTQLHPLHRPRIYGFYRLGPHGMDYVIWEDVEGRLHVTDGMDEWTDTAQVRNLLTLLKRIPAIDRIGMLALLRQYQRDSPLIDLLMGGGGNCS